MDSANSQILVILQDDQIATWLDRTVSDAVRLGQLLKAPPEEFWIAISGRSEAGELWAERNKIDAGFVDALWYIHLRTIPETTPSGN